MQKNYAFGDFIVRPAQRLLTRSSGEPIEIHAKAFDALVYLVQHRGEVVSRAGLTHTLWPKVVVEDNNLSQTIRALRRALDDAGPTYRFIITVPRRGYQFVATVSEAPPEVPRFESIDSTRPRFTSLAIYFACVAAMALLVTTMTRGRLAPDTEASGLHSSRPVADTVVEGYAPSWPLPEVVACIPEAARLMDPERCASAFRSVQEAERRRRHGLFES